MKRVLPWILIGLAVAAVVAMRLAKSPDEPEPEPELPGRFDMTPQGPWGFVDLPGKPFRLWLPKGWMHHETRGVGEIFRREEPDDGFWTNVHVYWGKEKRSLEDWYKLQRSKRMGGGTRILNEGRATTNDMAGYFLVYETKSRRPNGDTLVTITKDWLFGTRNHKGILRGISTVRSFMDNHALFNEIQKRLTRKP